MTRLMAPLLGLEGEEAWWAGGCYCVVTGKMQRKGTFTIRNDLNVDDDNGEQQYFFS